MSDLPLVKAGFIGCGSHASMCIASTLRMGNPMTAFNQIRIPIDLCAVADQDPQRAQRNARDFGAQRCYTDHRAMFDAEELDAVFIVVGGKLHAELVIEALERGLAVFVEKPPAETAADSWRIVQAARDADKPVQVAFNKRFATAYRMAHQHAQRDDFGPVGYVDVKMTGGGPSGPNQNGFEIDYIIHGIDLLHYFGGPVDQVTAYPLRDNQTYHGYAVSLRFASGAIGSAQFHELQGFGQRGERVEVVGQGQALCVDNVMDLRLYRQPKPMWDRHVGALEPETDDVVWTPNWTLPRDDNSSLLHLGYTGEVEAFAQAVQQGKPVSPSIQEAHETMVLLEAIMASQGQPITVDYGKVR